jgi:hypothetical protein
MAIQIDYKGSNHNGGPSVWQARQVEHVAHLLDLTRGSSQRLDSRRPKARERTFVFK